VAWELLVPEFLAKPLNIAFAFYRCFLAVGPRERLGLLKQAERLSGDEIAEVVRGIAAEILPGRQFTPPRHNMLRQARPFSAGGRHDPDSAEQQLGGGGCRAVLGFSRVMLRLVAVADSRRRGGGVGYDPFTSRGVRPLFLRPRFLDNDAVGRVPDYLWKQLLEQPALLDDLMNSILTMYFSEASSRELVLSHLSLVNPPPIPSSQTQAPK
jgi:hypothetical protein